MTEPIPPSLLVPRIKNRGKWLTTLLVLKGAFGLVMLFVALATLSAMTPARLARLPPDALAQVEALRTKLILTFGTTIIDLVAVTGMWMYKRWGVFVFAAASVMLLVLRIAQRETIIAIAGLIVSGSVAAAIVPKWPDYD
jgi:hypothetical protein